MIQGEPNGAIQQAVASMGGRDVAYYANEVPGVLFRLGQVLLGGRSGGHHTPDFQADNSAVPVSIRTMTNLLLDYSRGRTRDDV